MGLGRTVSKPGPRTKILASSVSLDYVGLCPNSPLLASPGHGGLCPAPQSPNHPG